MDDGVEGLIVGFVGGMMIAVIIFATCYEPAITVQEEAVKRGHATWDADSRGNTTFTWKKNIQKKGKD